MGRNTSLYYMLLLRSFKTWNEGGAKNFGVEEDEDSWAV